VPVGGGLLAEAGAHSRLGGRNQDVEDVNKNAEESSENVEMVNEMIENDRKTSKKY
jgi:hypothetical protein